MATLYIKAFRYSIVKEPLYKPKTSYKITEYDAELDALWQSTKRRLAILDALYVDTDPEEIRFQDILRDLTVKEHNAAQLEYDAACATAAREYATPHWVAFMVLLDEWVVQYFSDPNKIFAYYVDPYSGRNALIDGMNELKAEAHRTVFHDVYHPVMVKIGDSIDTHINKLVDLAAEMNTKNAAVIRGVAEAIVCNKGNDAVVEAARGLQTILLVEGQAACAPYSFGGAGDIGFFQEFLAVAAAASDTGVL